MKKVKLLTKLQRLFRPELNKNKSQAKELRSVLDKLKKKQRMLRNRIAATDDPEAKKHYQTELEIIRIQFNKGLAALREIRENIKKLSR